ncbi:MAG: pilus assembly protein PilM [Xanthomonadaceae bacterium]|nr:pilus assembly protein PilM [Xanthomonadaceae bacterium]
MIPFGRNSKPLIGLDISSSAVKLVELSRQGSSYRVEAYAAEAMPVGAINEKTIVDVEAAGEAVRRTVKRSGTRVKHAAIAIGGAAVITKVIQMPAGLKDSELGEQIELQADQYIPFPLEEVRYDYEVLGPAKGGDGEMVEVLLAATRADNVDQRQAVLDAAGITAKVVDIEAYALENACRLLTHQMPDLGVERTIAIVDFGATTTTFSVLNDLRIIYTRDQAFGGKQLTEEIMRQYGLSYEEAGKAKKHGGLPDNYNEEMLQPFMEDMAQQVNRSLQFFLSSNSQYETLDEVLICGGCSAITGVDTLIAERVGVPTQVGNPFGEMKISSKAKGQLAESDAGALMIACGLALRSFD